MSSAAETSVLTALGRGEEYSGVLRRVGGAGSLDRVALERDRLLEDVSRTSARLRDLAVTNRSSALRNTEVVSSTYESLAPLQTDLTHLSSLLPRLNSAVDQFLSRGRDSLDRWRLVRSAYDTLPKLTDLLEIPSLARACVRGGFHDEFLILESHLASLGKLWHGGAGGAENGMMAEMAREMGEMREVVRRQLEESLRRPGMQLPGVVRAVGLLRRMGAYSGEELRVVFLVCRDRMLVDAVQACEEQCPRGSSPAGFLSRAMDAVRTGIFDAVTQYRAIFSVEESAATPLHCWVTSKVSWFLAMLEECVARVSDGNSLANLLDQCMYTGLSLGRVSIDIRGLVAPIFTKRVESLFVGATSSAVAQFRLALSAHTFSSGPRAPMLLFDKKPHQPASSFPAASSPIVEEAGGVYSGPRAAPPFSLLEHPPIASFVNAVTAALNELRLCAPRCLKQRLCAHMTEILRDAVDSAAFHAESCYSDDHRASVEAFCEAVADDMVPYLTQCFDNLWRSSAPMIDWAPLLIPLQQFFSKPDLSVLEDPAPPQSSSSSVGEPAAAVSVLQQSETCASADTTPKAMEAMPEERSKAKDVLKTEVAEPSAGVTEIPEQGADEVSEKTTADEIDTTKEISEAATGTTTARANPEPEQVRTEEHDPLDMREDAGLTKEVADRQSEMCASPSVPPPKSGESIAEGTAKEEEPKNSKTEEALAGVAQTESQSPNEFSRLEGTMKDQTAVSGTEVPPKEEGKSESEKVEGNGSNLSSIVECDGPVSQVRSEEDTEPREVMNDDTKAGPASSGAGDVAQNESGSNDNAHSQCMAKDEAATAQQPHDPASESQS